MKTLRRVKNPVRESNEIVPRDFDFFRLNDSKLDGRFVFYSLVMDGPYSPYAFVLGSDINKLKFEDYGIPKVIFNYWNAPIMKKVVIWRIKDEQKMNKKNIRKIVLAIKRKVDRLVIKLRRK